MNNNKNILPVQIKKIHIALSQLSLPDENYRDILSNFINAKGEKCRSCKELNENQANILLGILKKLGWTEKKKGKQLKYEEFNNREAKYATPAQMRKIEALWMRRSREKTEKSLNNFINRIAEVNHITFLLRKDVQKVIKAIESLGRQSSIDNHHSGVNS